MSAKPNSVKTTNGPIDSNTEIQSYIHQQILEFEPFITPETLVMVIAREPDWIDPESEDEIEPESLPKTKHRIAIVLKEEEGAIEAEAFHDDIFLAIKQAKENMIVKLLEIQDEIENPNDRLIAIQQMGSSNQVH